MRGYGLIGVTNVRDQDEMVFIQKGDGQFLIFWSAHNVVTNNVVGLPDCFEP